MPLVRDSNRQEVSERLRSLIDDKYPSRGRFTVLAEVSGISAARWKNFYYRKQDATPDMLDFWCRSYPMEKVWLTTGIDQSAKEGFPFAAPVPHDWEGQTVGDRLNWVIKEWASPSGEHLFRYLEGKSGGRIPAADWSKVVLRMEEPTIEMIRLVCSYRPRFTEWVMLGSVSGEPAVDPTDLSSIEKWKAWRAGIWARLEENAAAEDSQQAS